MRLASNLAFALLLACSTPPPRAKEPVRISPSDARVTLVGRAARLEPGKLRIGYPGVTLRVAFDAPELALEVEASSDSSRLGVVLDGGDERMVRLKRGTQRLLLAEGLAPGVHSVALVHRTETWQGVITIQGLVVERGQFLPAPAARPRRLLVIGDSVTCGEAIDRKPDCNKNPDWWDPSASYGMLLGRALDAEVHLVCYGGRGLIRDWQGHRDVLNAPQFFELSVPDAAEPLAWNHADYTPDLIVVSLGTNDFNLALGALPSAAEYVPAYVSFVRTLRARHPMAKIVLTEGAMVSDDADPTRPQRSVLRSYLRETVERVHDGAVSHFEASHQPGDACDPHPTREQHQRMAAELGIEARRLLGL
jgi:lysophospholipase L1-like esterase